MRILETVSQTDVISWYKVNIHPLSPTRRKLGVWVVGQQQAASQESPIDPSFAYAPPSDSVSVEVFKSTNALWESAQPQPHPIIINAYAGKK